jgi:AcrR family transcriptional regulator
MFNFKTAGEKAAEWGVTLRYIQLLCREGKIDGAVKRAGAWFIPAEAPNPVKNSKAGDRPFSFVGTKKRIFENAIKLFTQNGYENVSINDIADSVGIRQSAVYNHFKSKQEILDTIYSFYYHHNLSNRPSQRDLEALLKTGSLIDILTKGFVYEFEESVIDKMTDIAKIIMQRTAMDEKAAELFHKLLLEDGVSFVENGLNRAVQIGRLAPFDTHVVAVLIHCVRFYALIWWLIGPSYEEHQKIEKDEQAMYKHVAALLTDLQPPAERTRGQ